MIQIEPVVFPLNLGTANQLDVNISANPSIGGARINYSLIDGSYTPIKRLTHGSFNITESDFVTHGSDKDWITNYVVGQLGVTLI